MPALLLRLRGFSSGAAQVAHRRVRELVVQLLRPVVAVGEELDPVDGRVRVADARLDAVQLEAREPDLVGFVEVGLVEVRLARGGDAIALARVVRSGNAVGATSLSRRAIAVGVWCRNGR
jgi:hypothetical protein